MRITVFGAGGSVGSRVVAEAVQRGHEVTAVARDPARARDLPELAVVRQGDATDVEQVARLAAGQDVVVGATRPAPGREHELVAAARALLAGTRQAGTRLILVGGAATLTVPATGALVVDDPELVTEEWRAIALACADQHEACRADDGADWTYLSPPAVLAPGTRTGSYRRGRDELLVDADGRSAISIEDFALALLDEAEHPRHLRARFTVAA